MSRYKNSLKEDEFSVWAQSRLSVNGEEFCQCEIIDREGGREFAIVSLLCVQSVSVKLQRIVADIYSGLNELEKGFLEYGNLGEFEEFLDTSGFRGWRVDFDVPEPKKGNENYRLSGIIKIFPIRVYR